MICKLLCILTACSLLGCNTQSRHPEPRLNERPICFTERKAGEWIWDKLDRIEILSVPEVLLLPQFARWDGHRVVARIAHPIIYRPGTEMVFPGYSREHDGPIDSVTAVVPGYLPTHISQAFLYHIDVNGVSCGVVELVPARNADEGAAITRAFEELLHRPSFQVGGATIVEDLDPQRDWSAYALSGELASETVYFVRDRPPIPAPVWNYAEGTRIEIDLSEQERHLVEAHLAKQRSSERYVRKRMNPESGTGFK